jgi:DNA (cytosine-5)-methyltransferase 1
MVPLNILDKEVFNKIMEISNKRVDFILASPPCQGMSISGKSRNVAQMINDKRNYLIFKVIEFISLLSPRFILIENVRNLLKLQLPFQNQIFALPDLLTKLFKDKYIIESEILDTSSFGIPQRRNRAIIKLYKKGESWGWVTEQEPITVRQAIGHLPSLEAGQKSNIKWHFARHHLEKHVLWMKHTPTGKSAFENEFYYPVKENGERIKSYNTTYRRIKWDEPAPTITIRNDAISSQLNVHPGRQLPDGTYSDARVLTPLELMILSSIPENWNIPEDSSEILIRQCIGECIPPLLVKKIVSQIRSI